MKPKDAPAGDRRAAADEFRRIGAGLISRHYASYPWANCTYDYVLRWLEWDIHSVGNLLIGIGRHGVSATPSRTRIVNNPGSSPAVEAHALGPRLRSISNLRRHRRSSRFNLPPL